MVSRALRAGEVEAKFLLPSELLTSEVLILEVLKVSQGGFLELWPKQRLCLVVLDHAGKSCVVSTKAQHLIRGTGLLSRISGNAASDKNIKDGVCAQIEKNFARAKWKVGLGSLSSWPGSKCFFLHPQFLAAAVPLQLSTDFPQAILCGGGRRFCCYLRLKY